MERDGGGHDGGGNSGGGGNGGFTQILERDDLAEGGRSLEKFGELSIEGGRLWQV